ncbi:MAG: homocysteine S-methyltransferase family protein, partial [Paracoccaceae bacterium]
LLILETMSGVDQARGALMGAKVTDKPVWLALSVDDADGTRLRSGEPLDDAVALLRDLPPQGVLINCSTPEAVSAALPLLATTGLPFGAYANGFTKITSAFAKGATTVNDLSARQDLSPDAYADFAARWHALGATLIGGCCEVGPAHISALAHRLKGA